MNGPQLDQSHYKQEELLIGRLYIVLYLIFRVILNLFIYTNLCWYCLIIASEFLRIM